jgi:hypothetical protein
MNFTSDEVNFLIFRYLQESIKKKGERESERME